jgi:hypothetical protein
MSFGIEEGDSYAGDAVLPVSPDVGQLTQTTSEAVGAAAGGVAGLNAMQGNSIVPTGQGQSNQTVQGQVQQTTQSLTVGSGQPVVEWKFHTPDLIFGSGTSSTGSTLFNSIANGNFSVNPEITRSFTDKVEYNLGINLGPSSTANIDSVLSAWESDNGYYLQPDKFGIYRKFKNGIMDSDDAYKVSILDSAYDKAVHDAFTEIQRSNNLSETGTGGSEGDSKTDITYIRKLQLKGMTEKTIDTEQNQYKSDITEWSKRYNEIQKRIDQMSEYRRVGLFNPILLKSDYSGITGLVTNVSSLDDLEGGNNFLPAFPLTPRGTQDYYFGRAGLDAYHRAAASMYDLAPTLVMVSVIDAQPELILYTSRIKPVISAVCEVEKNMHLNWEDVERGNYTYRDAIKHSLLPLGIELGPADYTAKKVSDIIVQKYNLPEIAKPILEDALSKMVVNIAERSIKL